MANHKSGVQRRNEKMYAMFDKAAAEGRGLNGVYDKEKHSAAMKALGKKKDIAGKVK